MFQAIADPTRRRVMGLLMEGEQSIAALCGQFDMSRTAVVKHLHVLLEAGLVIAHKVGREQRFQLRSGPLAKWFCENDFELRKGHKFQFRSKRQGNWDGIMLSFMLKAGWARKLKSDVFLNLLR